MWMIYIFFGCAPPNSEPDWMRKQPTLQGYWYGVGTVDKHLHSDYRELARTSALEEIASQISVQISSSMISVVTELNYDLSTYTKSIMKSRLSQALPSVEYLESYETENRFYFLVRLSHKKYYNSIEESRRNAITTAIGYLDKAESDFSANSFTNLGNAWLEVKEFLDKPIEVEYPRGSSKSKNLYSLIKLKFADYIQRIELTPSVNNMNVKLFTDKDQSFTVTCTDKMTGTPIHNIPLIATLNSEEEKTKSVTDNQGKVEFHIDRIAAKSGNQTYYINVDLKSLINKSVLALAPLNYPGTQINLSIIRPRIYVQAKEKNFGEELSNPIISSAVKEFFVSEFSAVFVSKNEADFIIMLNVDTAGQSKQQNEYGLFVAYANASLKFVNLETGDEIYSKSITNVKGADFSSLKTAGERSIDKLGERLREKVLPEIIETLNE